MPLEQQPQRELYLAAWRAGPGDLSGARVSRRRAVKNREVGYVGDREIWMIQSIKDLRSELDASGAVCV